jgi:hypothetical protein
MIKDKRDFGVTIGVFEEIIVFFNRFWRGKKFF